MYGLLVGFGLMFDKGQKQSSTLSCDSSYYMYFFLNKVVITHPMSVVFSVIHTSFLHQALRL